MGNPYPANFETLQGSRRLTGQVDFTDAGNQPGAQAVELLGPFAITYQTAGLENPGGPGVVVHTIPAGTLLLASWIETTTPWANVADIDEISINLDGGTTILDIGASAGNAVNAVAYALTQDFATHTATGIWCRSSQDLCAAFFTSNPMSAGAGSVYALTASI